MKNTTKNTNANKTVKVALSVSAALLVAVAVGSSAMAEGYGKHKNKRHGGRGGIAPIFMQNADANGDNAITFEEMSVRIDTIFSEMDTDNDASLTKGELQSGLKAKMQERRNGRSDRAENAENKGGDQHKGRKFSEKRNGKRGGNNLDRLIERMDVNGDGQIAKSEVKDRMEKTFAFLDINSDGKLEGKELRKGKPGGKHFGKHGGKHGGKGPKRAN